MKDIVSIINFIRSNNLKHRRSQSFLVETDADYCGVLYYTAVRRLSRDSVLQRLFYVTSENIWFFKWKRKISHIKSFELKLKLFLSHINVLHFPVCKKFFDSSTFSLSIVIFVEAISIFQQEFNNRF